MYYYKTIIQYEGTNYAGFQWQNEINTIQSELNNALLKITKGKVTTVAASRTDTGVHAIGQVVKISSEYEISNATFLDSFNNVLPKDIRCTCIVKCEGLFKPSANTSSKEYRYFFTNQIQVKKNDMQFVANISNPLDMSAIRTCINALIGKHDFCNFYSSGSNVKSTVRTIFSCELTEVNPHDIFSGFELFHMPEQLTSCFQLRIEASGFLKQMIRHIVSALWMVGSGKLSTENFIALIDAPKDSKQHWKVASPNGLFLYSIKYL